MNFETLWEMARKKINIDNERTNLNKIKGGNTMETKSRYEALNDLEAQKRQLMQAKFSLKEEVKAKEKEIKMLKRDLEDKEEELKDLETSLPDKEAHKDALIEAVDKGIEAFTKQLKK